MRFLGVKLQAFRNVSFADLNLEQERIFFEGDNAQGKSNLMEALGFITALRSFRSKHQKLLLKEGDSEAQIAYTLEHERLGETLVRIVLKPDLKEIYIDENKVERFSDFVGLFPTVVFCTQDMQLLRGTPSLRRRFFDLTLSAMDAEYLQVLQSYFRALHSRNRLLKENAGDVRSLAAFERVLASSACLLIERRKAEVDTLANYLIEAYASMAGKDEALAFTYQADLALSTEAEFVEFWERTRQRDQLTKVTQRGPHRDDVLFKINGKAVQDYASEGQQRSVAIALKLGQVAYFREKSGVAPVVLADDILGELDGSRRKQFWAGLDEDLQVQILGTAFPETIASARDAWSRFCVTDGSFSLLESLVV